MFDVQDIIAIPRQNPPRLDDWKWPFPAALGRGGGGRAVAAA